MAAVQESLTSVLVFRTGGREMAVVAEAVSEVVSTPVITRVPRAPASLTGLVNIRGDVAPLVSLQTALDGAGEAGGERLSIVMHGAEPVALGIEGVTALRRGEVRGDRVALSDGDLPLLDLPHLLRAAFAGMAQRPRTARAEPDAAGAAATEAAALAFLEFSVAGQAYALPLTDALAVVALAAVSPAASDDPAIVGVMPYRDGVLPLVSLRTLLGLSADEGERVVVTRLGEAEFGLVVDKVSAILRVGEDAVGPAPAILNRGRGEARVESIVRARHGLVAVLAVGRLFDEATTARLLDAAGTVRRDRVETIEDAMEPFVIFRLGSETYGLPAGAVREVVRRGQVAAPAPRSPAFITGVMSHRGEPIPLVDQRVRFDVAADEAKMSDRILIATAGDIVVGLVVDGVEQVMNLPAEAVSATPALAAGASAVFDRVARFEVGGRMILLIDPTALVAEVERDLKAALAETSQGDSR